MEVWKSFPKKDLARTTSRKLKDPKNGGLVQMIVLFKGSDLQVLMLLCFFCWGGVHSDFIIHF